MSEQNARGRRRPELLTPIPVGQGPRAGDDEVIANAMTAEPEDQHGEENELQPDSLLYAGDIVTHSVTLAVDFGDRTHYIGTKATSRVQEGEHSLETQDRLIAYVNQQVLVGVDAIEEDIEEFQRMKADERERIEAELSK